jgi:hypothetical protein
MFHHSLRRALRLVAVATVIGVFLLPRIIDWVLLCLLIFLIGIWCIIFPPGLMMWAKAADPWDESMWWIPKLVGIGVIAISIVFAVILFFGVFVIS